MVLNYSYSRIFSEYSEKAARRFAASVNGDVWTDRDGFGQKVFVVRWNLPEE